MGDLPTLLALSGTHFQVSLIYQTLVQKNILNIICKQLLIEFMVMRYILMNLIVSMESLVRFLE